MPTYKKKTYTKRKPNAVAKLTKKVNQILKETETKFFDVSQVPVSTGDYMVNNVSTLLAPLQNGSKNGRDGSDVSPYRIIIKGDIIPGSASVPVAMRLILIQSKQGFVPSTNATSSVQKVFQDPLFPNTIYNPFDYNNRRHFTVLHDQTYTADAAGPALKRFVINKKISRNTVFDQGTGTATENGQIYLLNISNHTTTNLPILSFYSRIYYKDS